MDKKEPGINYLYFGAYFALLVLLSTCGIVAKDNLAGSRIFFWLYSVGQAGLEVSLFVFLAWAIGKKFGSTGLQFFIGFTFLCFFIHVLNFIADRILDLSIWEAAVSFIGNESYESFLLLLDASGISLWVWILIFASIISVPIFGLIFFKAASWITDKKPLLLKPEIFFQIFVCIPSALLFWDYSASNIIDPDAYTEFVKSLPWRTTFLQPNTTVFALNKRLEHLPSQKIVQDQIDSIAPLSSKGPNIYLFIVESLRSDFITEQTAPNLTSFWKQNTSARLSSSNANFTHLSWFSIFQSQLPFFWPAMRAQNWNQGALGLQAFKKLGYQIRVYSSAQLNFYEMQQTLFGEDLHLLDSYKTFHHPAPKKAWQSDRQTIDALLADMADKTKSTGQLYIIFLDTPHFDYSHPPNGKFLPEAGEIAFFRAYPSDKNIAKIENRYRNAVHYVDQLFGEAMQKINPQDIVAFTGDHGEEFFDHGHLFHGSHLSDEQISVPIYFRIPGWKAQLSMISQLDIMPTLLDAVSHLTFAFLAGESAMRPRTAHFVPSLRFNARQAPYEFAIRTEQYKMIARFNNTNDIFSSDSLQLLSLTTKKGQAVYEENIQPWIESEFGDCLKKFTSSQPIP